MYSMEDKKRNNKRKFLTDLEWHVQPASIEEK